MKFPNTDKNKEGERGEQKKTNKKGAPKPPKFFWSNVVTAVLILLIVGILYSFYVENYQKTPVVPISSVAQSVEKGDVSKIVVQGEELTVTYQDDSKKESKKETGEALTQTFKNYGVSTEALSGVNIKIEKPSSFGYWAVALAPFLIPLLFIGVLFWLITKQMKGSGGMQAFSFGQSKARIVDPDDKSKRVLFKDVAGAKEAKEELQEIVDFLRNPKKFISIGAEIPKGVILMGAPGTGKTLLARAVAGEAKVPFFHLSGSEFVEMFVGVGASRVRDLFKMAKKTAPTIIFIDEIDAVGRVRGSGVGGGNDEREQTLNQILTEMDGFEPNEKVIVMAATNRPDVLDPALLRPGRFDRRVTVDEPDRSDREQILKIHAEKKPLHDDVDLGVIAERTPGFSGADLYSLMNESAILAAREDRKEVTQYDLIRAIEKVMMGPERKSHILSKYEKKVTAYHEVGHALVASVLPHADPVHKISIISRGRAAGYTLALPLAEKKMHTKKEFLDRIAMSLGGYVTEQMLFGDLTTGPSNDIQVSTSLARDMVTKYGMSEKMGPVALEGSGGQALYGKGVGDRDYSEKVSSEIDAEVSDIMNEAYERAKKAIENHRDALDGIAKQLMKKETLEQPEYEELLVKYGIEPKRLDDDAEESASLKEATK